jgi:hypothetical protein
MEKKATVGKKMQALTLLIPKRNTVEFKTRRIGSRNRSFLNAATETTKNRPSRKR